MTSKPTNLPAVIFILIVVFTGCKKDSAPVAQPSQKMKLLTTGQWRLAAITDGSDDQYSHLPACVKDNYQIFKTDGTIEYNEGPTKCNPSQSQTSNGTWRFDKNETEIWLDGGLWTLEELTTDVYKIGTDTYTSTGSRQLHLVTFRR
jgi:hypothetical protein